MLEELCKRIQHCCATLPRSRNKRNVGSFWLKSLTGFKLCATTLNNMQHGVQTDATCNIQQWWELLAKNVAAVCTGLYLIICGQNLMGQPWTKRFCSSICFPVSRHKNRTVTPSPPPIQCFFVRSQHWRIRRGRKTVLVLTMVFMFVRVTGKKSRYFCFQRGS